MRISIFKIPMLVRVGVESLELPSIFDLLLPCSPHIPENLNPDAVTLRSFLFILTIQFYHWLFIDKATTNPLWV